MTPRTLSTDDAISHAPYDEEEALLNRGFSYVAGIDEVGRGPLAGPVVAGVVILPPRPHGAWLDGIRDSKAMTAAQRERSYDAIMENAWASATGQASALEIDEMGIVPATALAMRRALDARPHAAVPAHRRLSAAGRGYPAEGHRQGRRPESLHRRRLHRGEGHADRIMVEIDRDYPEYGFAGHKGYGSAEHIRKIETLGPCPVHRYSFAPIRHSGHSR